MKASHTVDHNINGKVDDVCPYPLKAFTKSEPETGELMNHQWSLMHGAFKTWQI
jgi:hypothetical protein